MTEVASASGSFQLSVPPWAAADFEASIAASSLTKASEKSFRPSASSWSVTSSSGTTLRSSSASCARAVSRPPSRLARGLPWSRKASIVCGGAVLTVSGPINPSM